VDSWAEEYFVRILLQMALAHPSSNEPRTMCLRHMKVFGIGLPRTGTTSLHHACRALGLKSVHFPSDKTTENELRKGNYRLSVLNTADVLGDIPVPAVFPQLDRAWPGAKFILTTRDIESWISSEAQASFNHDPPRPGTVRDFYRAILYGVTDYNEERFRWVFEDHHRRVYSYFSGPRQRDLLVMDVTKGDGWEKLCDFLGCDVPEIPFPHRNRSGVDAGDGRTFFVRLREKLSIKSDAAGSKR
jgi:Sulfotransferase domain